MELKVLVVVTSIPKIKPPWEPSSKTSRKAVGELEVELSERVLPGLLRLFARIFATVISSSGFYEKTTHRHSPSFESTSYASAISLNFSSATSLSSF